MKVVILCGGKGTRLREATWTETPDRFFPFLKQFIRYTEKCVPEYLIEGAAISPAHVAILEKETAIRACFLGTSSVSLTDIVQYASIDDWVSLLDKNEQVELPNRIIEFSKLLKAETFRLAIPYFDVGVDRENELQAAYKILVS